MYQLKRLAIQAGYYTASITGFSETFVGQVETYGRSFELGLATGHTTCAITPSRASACPP
jgi:hypothetical protein